MTLDGSVLREVLLNTPILALLIIFIVLDQQYRRHGLIERLASLMRTQTPSRAEPRFRHRHDRQPLPRPSIITEAARRKGAAHGSDEGEVSCRIDRVASAGRGALAADTLDRRGLR